jgi:hypothetical protein
VLQSLQAVVLQAVVLQAMHSQPKHLPPVWLSIHRCMECMMMTPI